MNISSRADLYILSDALRGAESKMLSILGADAKELRRVRALQSRIQRALYPAGHTAGCAHQPKGV